MVHHYPKMTAGLKARPLIFHVLGACHKLRRLENGAQDAPYYWYPAPVPKTPTSALGAPSGAALAVPGRSSRWG
jgi:hypothetical protein